MIGLNLETIPCPLCNSEERIIYDYKFDPYKVASCKKCGVWYLSTRLSEEGMLKQYASDEYFKGNEGGYSGYQDQEASLRLTFRRFLKELRKKYNVGGSLLEIGCGYGYLLSEAKKYFRSIEATDFSEEALSSASKFADAVYSGSIDSIPKNKLYDCIILAHVIEHIYSPIDFLKNALSHLNPGGIMAVATPNKGSIWFTVMGKKWPSFKVPEHIVFYERKTLSLLMKKSGLADINKVEYLHAFPLALTADKLKMKVPHFIKDLNIWIPGTTIAMVGKKPSGGRL